MAKLKHDEIVIPKDNPFANCKLNRQPYAEVLTDIVSNYADGFVMAINNEWGTGKTTFVKMWQQHLKNQGFQTLYFNAWENDFEDDVLVALLSELEELKDEKSKEVFKEVVKRAAPLAKKLLPSIAKALANRYFGDDFIKELIEGAADVSAEGLEAELRSYTNRKDSIQSFRQSLEKFVQLADTEKPVVFILDELDRCRPNYAVRVLEQIKHLFSVSGIIFVLSIDKVQLGHAVRGVYGSESLNADEYLRRFIDIEYSIPEPSVKAFLEYLYGYYRFDDFINWQGRRKTNQPEIDKKEILKYSRTIFEHLDMSLRIQEKIFSHVSLVLRTIKSDGYFPSTLIVLLTTLRIFRPELYMKISKRQIGLQELVDELFPIFPPEIHKSRDKYTFIDTEAQLLLFYSNYCQSLDRQDIILGVFEGGFDFKLQIKSKIDSSPNNRDLHRSVMDLLRVNYLEGFNLKTLLTKVDLIERLVEKAES